MTILSDGFTPAREEMERIERLREDEPQRPGHSPRGSLVDHEPDLTDVRGTHELHTAPARDETEPHGMYWARDAAGNLTLRPHQWFVLDIAARADRIFELVRGQLSANEETIEQYRTIGNALRAYIESRTEINDMVAARKFRQELDDAAYQFCQAAKYQCDAETRAQFLYQREGNVMDDERIQQLLERAEQSAREGFIVAYAVMHAGYTEKMNMQVAARRVLEYSCKRLTEWFATRRKNNQNQHKAALDATRALIDNAFMRMAK
jgi:chorismate mutase